MDLVVTYTIKPDSSNVVVTDVLDVRPAEHNKDGSYRMPDGLGGARQLGLSPRTGKALIYIQPPGVWVPDFGYGPITHRVLVKKRVEQLEGDYERFPSLPRFRETYDIELTEDGMPCVGKEAYEILLKNSPADAEKLRELMEGGEFCRAVSSVFECAGFEAALERAQAQERLA